MGDPAYELSLRGTLPRPHGSARPRRGQKRTRTFVVNGVHAAPDGKPEAGADARPQTGRGAFRIRELFSCSASRTVPALPPRSGHDERPFGDDGRRRPIPVVADLAYPDLSLRGDGECAMAIARELLRFTVVMESQRTRPREGEISRVAARDCLGGTPASPFSSAGMPGLERRRGRSRARRGARAIVGDAVADCRLRGNCPLISGSSVVPSPWRAVRDLRHAFPAPGAHVKRSLVPVLRLHGEQVRLPNVGDVHEVARLLSVLEDRGPLPVASRAEKIAHTPV